MATGEKRICPICDAENDVGDLFCKECGSNLLPTADQDQQTTVFTPIDPKFPSQTTSVAPAVATSPAYETTYSGYSPSSIYGSVPKEESARGAVLGWIAGLLMLIILATFFWLVVFGDSTRDRFFGIF